MSGSNRGKYFAFGLIAGLAISLLFVVWAVPEFYQPANEQVTQSTNQNQQNGSNGNDSFVDWLLGEMISTTQDTAAQWVMAILTVIAVFVSVWAVTLLNSTLVATKEAVRAADDAVEETKRIGQAQVRAYLYCEAAKFLVTERGVDLTLEIKNVGQSPAKDVAISAGMLIQDVGGMENSPRVFRSVFSVLRKTTIDGITASTNSEATIYFFWNEDFESDSAIGTNNEQLAEFGNDYVFEAQVTWLDVFGGKQEMFLDMYAGVDSGPNAPEIEKRISAGNLRIMTSNGFRMEYKNQYYD